MENSHRFFRNVDCQYYPCHHGVDELNCLFCYCPMYWVKDCPGTPEFIERDGRTIKKCANCVFPHIPENYDKVMTTLRLAVQGALERR